MIMNRNSAANFHGTPASSQKPILRSSAIRKSGRKWKCCCASHYLKFRRQAPTPPRQVFCPSRQFRSDKFSLHAHELTPAELLLGRRDHLVRLEAEFLLQFLQR